MAIRHVLLSCLLLLVCCLFVCLFVFVKVFVLVTAQFLQSHKSMRTLSQISAIL